MSEEKMSFDEELEARLTLLPPKVQEAMASADVEQHLRELSKLHRLHLDQWELLQKEVMITLLGLERAENLAVNIEQHVGLSHETAVALAGDVSRIVFEPIRDELESVTSGERSESVSLPATNETAAANTPEKKTTLYPDPRYTEVPSHQRKTVEDDPYREQP